jgi:hypothetical protein
MSPIEDGPTIKLAKLAVHILNNTTETSGPTLSDKECEITSEINDFFVAHMQNSIVDDNSKRAVFSCADAVVKVSCARVFERASRFIAGSRKMAEALFAPMRQNRTISPGDLAVCLCSAENALDQFVRNGQFIGIFKMDLTSAFTHIIRKSGDEIAIQIRPQGNVLPSPKQRLQKCVLIRPSQADQYDMIILDNQIAHLHDAAGVANFFSRTFLQAELWLSDRDKTRLFRSLTAQWIKQHYDELSPDQADAVTKGSRLAILSDAPVHLREFANVLIPSEPLRHNYLQFLRDNRLEDVQFSADQQYAQQATKRKKYKAEGGLTVSGDADEFDRLVTINPEKDAQNRFTITIKTTRWIEDAK